MSEVLWVWSVVFLFFVYYFECLSDFLFYSLVGIYPIYCVTATFHATKPCHLAFGELVDCCFKTFEHFIEGKYAN